MARIIAVGTLRDAKVIGLLSFGHLLSHFYFMLLPPIMPLIKAEFSANYLEVGLLMTAYAMAGALAQTPVGFLVDRIGGRPVLVWGLLIEGLAISGIGFTGDFWQVFVLYAIGGAANAVFHPADYAIMSASVGRERLGRAYSIHLFSGNLGFALAPPVMSFLTVQWNWRVGFIVVGAVAVLLALYMFTQGMLLDDGIGERTAQARRKRKDGKTDDLASGLRLLFSFPILMCLGFFMMMTLGFTGVRSYFVAALDVMFHTPNIVANAALGGFLTFSAIGILAGGVLADRIGPRISTAVVTLVFAGAAIAVVGTIPLSSVLLMVVMSVSGFLQGLLMPTRDLLIRAVTPDGSMGKVMGFLSTGMMVSAAVVPAVFGWLLDAGRPGWVFWLSAFFVTGALLTFTSARSITPAR
jgi:MFS family permease